MMSLSNSPGIVIRQLILSFSQINRTEISNVITMNAYMCSWSCEIKMILIETYSHPGLHFWHPWPARLRTWGSSWLNNVMVSSMHDPGKRKMDTATIRWNWTAGKNVQNWWTGCDLFFFFFLPVKYLGKHLYMYTEFSRGKYGLGWYIFDHSYRFW